jgi:cell division protein FtsI (penicillin-binding protein 3)
MQLICAVSAIANNGILMKPYLVQAITDINGKIIKNTVPQPLRRVVSENTALALKKIMKSVIEEEGTGTNAALEGYQVCGKTGTAQKLGPSGTYEKGKYISSFIGFVPADDPALAIYVVVDEPQKRHYGGTIAAPAFKNIAHESLDYLNIPPTQDPDIFTVSWDSEVRG